MRRALLPVLTLLLALPVAGRAQVSAETREAIETANARWMEAVNSDDGETVAGLYTSDAFLLPPGSEPIGGTEDVRAFWTAAASAGNQFELDTRELYGVGDMLAEVGGYVLTAPTGAHLDHGKYMVLWKKEDGEWKLFRDIWNSSMTD
jgi:uncharacterized protein (TIGR02246 family)